MTDPATLTPDTVIFGGGAAGLWLLDTLVRRGEDVLVLESGALGSGQTSCSQGIIHGGLKYTLDGLLHGSASAIREMPAIWRECLAGRCTPDLQQTRVRADCCHLWRTASIRSRVGMIGARAGLRVAQQKLAVHERPAVLAGCPGTVARLDEQVIDPVSLLTDFMRQHPDRLLRIQAGDAIAIEAPGAGRVLSISISNPDGNRRIILRPRQVVLTAGSGNASLRELCGLSTEVMQRRPLHMVMMRGPLPSLNGHCVDGARTRVTVTSDLDAGNRTVWQLGGQMAEDGVDMDEASLIERARREMLAVLPDLDLQDVEWATYRVDRAEPATETGARPDDVFATREEDVITAWPTKLALAPRLAERVTELLDPPSALSSGDLTMLADWPRPSVALPPWEGAVKWS